MIILYLRKEEKEFINIKNIILLIIKLLYYIKMIIFMKLIKRNERNENDIKINKNLSDIRIYIRNLIQNLFNFLRKIIYLIIIIIKDIIFLL